MGCSSIDGEGFSCTSEPDRVGRPDTYCKSNKTPDIGAGKIVVNKPRYGKIRASQNLFRGGFRMEESYRIHETMAPGEKVVEMHRGANWFYYVAILAALNSIVAMFTGMFGFSLGFGISQYVDGWMLTNIGQGSPESVRWVGVAINLLIAGLFAAFGYFSRRGSDIAFIVGMFLYIADAMLILMFKDGIGFAFHLLALFFMFKGLLGSRKRYDPSV
jgi:hypothetical protein